jgi:hypothetical protein
MGNTDYQAYEDLERAERVLRRIEWQGRQGWSGYAPADACPDCRGLRPEGHKPDCELAESLAAAEAVVR